MRGEEEDAYRVAWRNLRDEAMIPRALSETEIVDMPLVVVPCATEATGQTGYAKRGAGQWLRGDGAEVKA
jgi:hypothetical protein